MNNTRYFKNRFQENTPGPCFLPFSFPSLKSFLKLFNLILKNFSFLWLLSVYGKIWNEPTTGSLLMFAQSEIIIFARNGNMRLLLVVVQTCKVQVNNQDSSTILKCKFIWWDRIYKKLDVPHARCYTTNYVIKIINDEP